MKKQIRILVLIAAVFNPISVMAVEAKHIKCESTKLGKILPEDKVGSKVASSADKAKTSTSTQ